MALISHRHAAGMTMWASSVQGGATAAAATPIVEVQGLVKHFGPVQALRGVDISVRTGETLVIIGPSGSGKSTLLRCINYLEIPDEGLVLIGGRPIGREVHRGRQVSLGE